MAITKWALDPTHSEIGFKVKHLMFTNVSGKFAAYEASVETDDDDFSTAKISFSADANSISTGNEQRDGHLKGTDFFDAAAFPNLQFTGTALNKIDGENYELVGDLTIKDVTQSVKLNAEYGGLMKDPWGNIKTAFSITGKINRKDWGLSWNAPLETGGVLVSEEVRLNCDIQFVKQS